MVRVAATRIPVIHQARQLQGDNYQRTPTRQPILGMPIQAATLAPRKTSVVALAIHHLVRPTPTIPMARSRNEAWAKQGLRVVLPPHQRAGTPICPREADGALLLRLPRIPPLPTDATCLPVAMMAGEQVELIPQTATTAGKYDDLLPKQKEVVPS